MEIFQFFISFIPEIMTSKSCGTTEIKAKLGTINTEAVHIVNVILPLYSGLCEAVQDITKLQQ